MNGDLLDFVETEDLGFNGYGESYDDYESEDDGGYGEEYFGEDGYYQESAEAVRDHRTQAAVRARQSARARALALARRGVPITRPRRPTYFPPTSRAPASTPQVRQGFSRVAQDIQKTQAAVQTVNLDNKVQTDSFGRALRSQRDRIGRNEYALTATKVVDELKDRFPDLFQNEVLRTVIPLAPLLFLQPHKRGRGFESVISDPRVWGPLLVGGIALFNETRGKEPQEVVITPGMFTLHSAGASVPLLANAYDRSRRIISPQPAFTWASSNTAVATVDANGVVSAVSAGNVLITATVTGTNVRNVATITVEFDDETATEIIITPGTFSLTAAGATVPLAATVRDRSGRILKVQPTVTFVSSDTTKATVDPNTGMVTAVAAGTVLITATVVGTSIRSTATINIT